MVAHHSQEEFPVAKVRNMVVILVGTALLGAVCSAYVLIIL